MDSYCYKNTNVLVNKFNIMDNRKLNKIEKDYSLFRLDELMSKKDYEISLKRYMFIHNYLFSDIYPFAGKIRTVNLKKGDYVFSFKDEIVSKLHDVIYDMKTNMGRINDDNVISCITNYYLKLNEIHPFREGNGRTNREFIREYASILGYDMDYSKTNKDLYEMYTKEDNIEALEKEFSKTLGLSKRR